MPDNNKNNSSRHTFISNIPLTNQCLFFINIKYRTLNVLLSVNPKTFSDIPYPVIFIVCIFHPIFAIVLLTSL